VNYPQDLQSNWDEFGQIDPLWATGTIPSKKGNKWELSEFFNSGQQANSTKKENKSAGCCISILLARGGHTGWFLSEVLSFEVL
jgi:hypothetical protein